MWAYTRFDYISVENTYFSYYAADAILYFYGARQEVAAYHEEWSALVDAGGAVEKNELSDIRVQVMQGGNVAISSYFINYQLRSPDGETSTAKAYETDVWQKTDGNWKIVSLHYTEIPAADRLCACQADEAAWNVCLSIRQSGS